MMLFDDEDNDFQKNTDNQEQITNDDNFVNHNDIKSECNGNQKSDFWKEKAKRMECELRRAEKSIRKLQKKYEKATSKLEQSQSFMKDLFAKSSSSPLSSTNTTPNSKTVSKQAILPMEKTMTKDISTNGSNINKRSVAQRNSTTSPALVKVSGRIKRIKRENEFSETDQEAGCPKRMFPSSKLSSTLPHTINCPAAKFCNENRSFSPLNASQKLLLSSSKIPVKRKLLDSETGNIDFLSDQNMDRSLDIKRKIDDMVKAKTLESINKTKDGVK